MKTLILFILIGLTTVAKSQSMLISNIATSTTLSPNAVMGVTVAANNSISNYFDIKNTSSTTTTLTLKRYDVTLNSGALAYFAFAGIGYPAQIDSAAFNLVLPSGQWASQQFSSDILTAYLDEGSTAGYSSVRYSLININQPSDSTQFTINYNSQPLGLNTNSGNQNSIQFFPNPVNAQNKTITLQIKAGENHSIKLFNANGMLLMEKEPEVAEEKILINLSNLNLNAGIYLLQVISNGKTKCAKLIMS